MFWFREITVSNIKRILYLLSKKIISSSFLPGATAPSGPQPSHNPSFKITLKKHHTRYDSSGRVIGLTERVNYIHYSNFISYTFHIHFLITQNAIYDSPKRLNENPRTRRTGSISKFARLPLAYRYKQYPLYYAAECLIVQWVSCQRGSEGFYVWRVATNRFILNKYINTLAWGLHWRLITLKTWTSMLWNVTQCKKERPRKNRKEHSVSKRRKNFFNSYEAICF